MYELTCDALPGFILQVLSTGKKVFLVRYRLEGKDLGERIGLWVAGLLVDDASSASTSTCTLSQVRR